MPDYSKNKEAYNEPTLDIILFNEQSKVVTVSGEPAETEDPWSKDYL